jgi:hypothetical protein
MAIRMLVLSFALAGLAACTTPYRPAVFVDPAPELAGLASLVEQSGSRPVDVVLVHGMGTHDAKWAHDTIAQMVSAIDTNVKPSTVPELAAPPDANSIQVVQQTVTIGAGSIRFTALIWSPLTATLKQQLAYDDTGTPTDCAMPGECKPKRAKLNGILKDGLLNDRLSDAMIYQGQSRAGIRRKMVEALTKVIEDSDAAARRAASTPGPLVVVSESLGSKLTFDALVAMLDPRATALVRGAGERAVGRMAQVFMAANQLPILGLADQDASDIGPRLASEPAPGADSLQNFLRTIERPSVRRAGIAKIRLVGFTDPNDLLSYRLKPSRYASAYVDIADVLVSNESTFLGFLERPDTAHTSYLTNPNVASIIACGRPKSSACR